MSDPKLKYYNPNTEEWEQIAPAMGEFDEVLQNVNSHLSEEATELNRGHMSAADKTKLNGIETGAQVNTVSSVAGKTGAVTLTKSDVGLSNVNNVKQMPIAGGTFTGIAVAQNNTSYTTKQIRNVYLSTSAPSGGGNGDICLLNR